MALNLIGSFQQGQQARQARRDARYLAEERARVEEQRNRLAELMRGGLPTTPEEGRAMGAEIGALTGDPGLALDWQRHYAEKAPDVLAQRKAEAPFVVAELGAVTDQAGYEAAVGRLQRAGVDVSDFPPEYNPNQTNMVVQSARYLAEGPAEPVGGPFEGTGLQAQATNILLSADPSSPEYAAAYSIMQQPRTYLDPGSGQIVSVAPDMTAFRSPTGAGAPAPAAPAQPRAPSAQAEAPMGQPGRQGITVKPIPGSKAAREAEEEREAAEMKAEAKSAQASLVVEEIGRVERLIEEATIPATGFVGNIARKYAGTNAADVDRILNTIRANVGFDRLQQMREQSPTGGALGQVSENENKLLQSVLGSLEQSLSEDEFKYNLARLKDTFLDIVHGKGNRPDGLERPEGPQGLDFENMSDEELRRLAQ